MEEKTESAVGAINGNGNGNGLHAASHGVPAIDLEAIRRAQAEGLTYGVVPRNGHQPRERKEIDDFIDDIDMTNIFMVALDSLMRDDWRDPFSYFQIAGIHGEPWAAWNGVQPPIGRDDDDDGGGGGGDVPQQSGYCSHSSILFPTWHRAYLMMLEQALYLRMADLAEAYPEPWRARYRAATDRFGLPYWDPFLPRRKLKNVHGYYFYQTGLPVIVTVATVRVRYSTSPDKLTDMPNPLAKFVFPTGGSGGGGGGAVPPRNRSPPPPVPPPPSQPPPASVGDGPPACHEGGTDGNGGNYGPTTTRSDEKTPGYAGGGDETQEGREVKYRRASAKVVEVPSRRGSGARSLDLGVPSGPPPLTWASVQNMPQTMRQHTIRGVNPDGLADIAYVNKALDYALSHSTGRGVSLGGKLYRLLVGPPRSYVEVSNSAFHPEINHGENLDNGQNSVEGFHNDIHVLAGSGPGEVLMGHMGLNEYAAFDPLFWLHHCNIDRITALWQALNPDKWFDEHTQRLDYPTFAAKAGTFEGTRTPLFPFGRRSDPHRPGWQNWTYWTSDDLRRIADLGYTYPEIPRGAGTGDDDDSAVAAAVTRYVTNTLEWSTIGGRPPAYEDLGFTPLLNLGDQEFARHEFLPTTLLAEDGLFTYIHSELHIKTRNRVMKRLTRVAEWCRERLPGGVPRRYRHISGLIHDDAMYQWNATIQVEKFALSGSFAIFLFLGEPSDDPSSWTQDRNMIGSDGIFAAQSRDHCSNCQEQYNSRLIDSDTIPLTPPLISYWRTQEALNGMRVESLYPSDVRPFLRANLHWRIMDRTGRVYTPDATPELARSLRIEVGCQLVTLPSDPCQRPVYSKETIFADITDQKRGGLHHGESFSDVYKSAGGHEHRHAH